MILVTGGTGFVGQVLIRHLVAMNKPVRTLLRPSPLSPDLPRGVPVEVAVCSFKDQRSLRAAMKDVDIVFHLASSERNGASRADLTGVDIEGTQAVVQAAEEAGVKRFVYLSHLGADRSSAFPLLKAKAIAEGFVSHSRLTYTIIRSALIFGINDQFTTSLARLLRMSPGFFLMPGDGMTMIQPIWVEDLVTCLTWAIEDSSFESKIISIGGAEYLAFRTVVELLLDVMDLHRFIISVNPAYLRIIGLWVEQIIPHMPVSSFWLDYLAIDRTVALDSVPRLFGLMPSRFSQQIDYIREIR